MSAQALDKMNGLVAVNSLMAMVGGTLVAVLLGKNDPGFAYDGPLAGLVAVCAGSDLMHPLGALAAGYIIYGALKAAIGLRLDPEQEFQGADLSVHRISSTPERESNW